VGQPTNDAAVIEFDFIPENDFVSFQYVFGSEEYLEYVGSSFNDVFAFFVNGTNYALLPNDDVVSINNVNLLVNSGYYVDNDPRISPDAALDTEMDGFTTVLTFLAPVVSGETNHLKIAVGDTFDAKYDSTVLIEAGSLTSRKSDLSLTKTVDISRPGAQETVAYTLTVHNAGPDAATGVVVEDSLPQGLMYAGYQGDGTYALTEGMWHVPTIPAGEDATLTLYAIVRQGGSMTNWAEIVESDNFDPDSVPGNGDSSEDDIASIGIDPLVADLSLSKSADTTTGSIGDEVTFTISVRNDGPDAASGVTVKDAVPAALTLLSATGDGTYNMATNIWSLPALPSGADARIDITGRILSGGTLSTSAEVWRSGCFDPDSVPGNGIPAEDDYDSVTINPMIADVSLTIDVDNSRPGVGEMVRCEVTAFNDGPETASGVTVSIEIPAGLSYVSSTGGYDHDASAWDIGTIEQGASASLGIVMQVQSHLPDDIVAEVAAMQQSDIDSTPGNGIPAEDDYDSVTVAPRYSDLFIVSAVDDAHPLVGSEVEIIITVANDGPDPTTGVVLANVLSAGLTYVSHDGCGSYDSASDTWTVGSIAVHGSASLTIRATVASNEAMTCTAEVLSSDNYDPDSVPGNGITTEDDFALVAVDPFVDNKDDEKWEEQPYNHFAILMPVVVTNMGDATSTWGCLIDELPEEVPEAIAQLMDQISLHMANATSYTNTIYVNSELEKALSCMKAVDALLDCGCWEQYNG
jgi:uncharacterized repeat protein (TIGR01451 family)